MPLSLFMTIIAAVLAVPVVLVWMAYREALKYGTTTTQELVGICTVALDQTVRKQANVDRALALLRERGELTNTDIREALGVASRTAVRYMDELERQGRVVQVGRTGHTVTYRAQKSF